jgi:uncharacterized protein DUF6916
MLDLLRCEDFEPHLHSAFAMTAGGATTSLELIAVERLPREGVTRQPFSLLFRGGTIVQPQGIYQLSRAGAGQFEIFLVPVGKDASGVRYEAIFS